MGGKTNAGDRTRSARKLAGCVVTKPKYGWSKTRRRRGGWRI